MSRHLAPSIVGTCVLLSGAIVCAGVPEPDAIFFGQVHVNGVLVNGHDTSLTLIAKVTVGGTPQEVGRYVMGDNPGAGDANNYCLHIRLENIAADASTQSNNAALVGQNASIYFHRGTGPDVLAASNVTLTARGMVQQLNLSGTIPGAYGDVNGDGLVNTSDIGAFVQVLLGLDQTPSHVQSADMNTDGSANGKDVQPFVNALTAQ